MGVSKVPVLTFKEWNDLRQAEAVDKSGPIIEKVNEILRETRKLPVDVVVAEMATATNHTKNCVINAYAGKEVGWSVGWIDYSKGTMRFNQWTPPSSGDPW